MRDVLYPPDVNPFVDKMQKLLPVRFFWVRQVGEIETAFVIAPRKNLLKAAVAAASMIGNERAMRGLNLVSPGNSLEWMLRIMGSRCGAFYLTDRSELSSLGARVVRGKLVSQVERFRVK